jgi:hypothetical protein
MRARQAEMNDACVRPRKVKTVGTKQRACALVEKMCAPSAAGDAEGVDRSGCARDDLKPLALYTRRVALGSKKAPVVILADDAHRLHGKAWVEAGTVSVRATAQFDR